MGEIAQLSFDLGMICVQLRHAYRGEPPPMHTRKSDLQLETTCIPVYAADTQNDTQCDFTHLNTSVLKI